MKENLLPRVLDAAILKPFLGIDFKILREVRRLAQIEKKIASGEITDPEAIAQFQRDAEKFNASF